MAEILAQLEKKGGGGMSEKVLWTNPSPTSSFPQTACSLSESIDNFDYIKILYRVSTSNNTQGVAIWPISTIKISTGGSNHIRASFTTQTSANIYSRVIAYVSNTSLQIGQSIALNTSGTDNATGIPLAIYGLK